MHAIHTSSLELNIAGYICSLCKAIVFGGSICKRYISGCRSWRWAYIMPQGQRDKDEKKKDECF